MATAEESGKEEGANLLGSPSFSELGNGRFKCVETGHEVLSKDIDFYSRSKKCRLGLIDFALSNHKPPLNMFNQDPLCRSKVICKLTGDKVNKSEKHIWKHMTGKRFLNKLEQEEEQKLAGHGMEGVECSEEPQSADSGKKDKKKKKKKKKKEKSKEKGVEEIISEVRDPSNEGSSCEEEDFWMPPVGERWDNDDGGDRWGTDSESEQEIEEGERDITDGFPDDEGCRESEELSSRTKRMSIEVGPSSFASRKKKSKKSHET
ncbi:uncharacterized protein LOC130935063 [Arachis stenosperma]|uniref:uncharacterized protein LOC130935063 n=1 Tax=Arachis stenosperma TaxID=217475 RepID=UPI0025AB961F|nr:uncharacterized protein LOC130935063 [Arachis stenosperma]XP_057720602.1 uncharacterized protein LOC130935063 [Arachis stenosperma]